MMNDDLSKLLEKREANAAKWKALGANVLALKINALVAADTMKTWTGQHFGTAEPQPHHGPELVQREAEKACDEAHAAVAALNAAIDRLYEAEVEGADIARKLHARLDLIEKRARLKLASVPTLN
jgi:hypothetical protein